MCFRRASRRRLCERMSEHQDRTGTGPGPRCDTDVCSHGHGLSTASLPSLTVRFNFTSCGWRAFNNSSDLCYPTAININVLLRVLLFNCIYIYAEMIRLFWWFQIWIFFTENMSWKKKKSKINWQKDEWLRSLLNDAQLIWGGNFVFNQRGLLFYWTILWLRFALL